MTQSSVRVICRTIRSNCEKSIGRRSGLSTKEGAKKSAAYKRRCKLK